MRTRINMALERIPPGKSLAQLPTNTAPFRTEASLPVFVHTDSMAFKISRFATRVDAARYCTGEGLVMGAFQVFPARSEG